MDYKEFHIFTDGSVTNQAKTKHKKHLRTAGIGVYHPDSKTQISKKFPLENPTNIRAEYYACITALKWVLENTTHLTNQKEIKVFIYTDLQNLINSMTKWVHGWKKRGWKKSNGNKVLNVELLKELDLLITNKLPHTHFIKVKSHCKEKDFPADKSWIWKGNYIADKLANKGRLE